MLAAATSLAFHGLLRVSEFTAKSPHSFDPSRTLLKKHIRFSSGGSLRIHIPASKTDQQCWGQKILVGRTATTTCPSLTHPEIPGLRQATLQPQTTVSLYNWSLPDP